jgi:TolB-like protein
MPSGDLGFRKTSVLGAFMKTIIGAIMIIATLVSCAAGPRVYVPKKSDTQIYKTLAILPFDNYSGKEDAGKQVTNAFLVELLRKKSFHVIDPGEVDRVMREERIRSSNEIDAATAKIFKDKLSADYIMIGAVNEYNYIRENDRDVPLVGFVTRLLDTSTGQIVWAASHSRRGSDGELIFGWRGVNSLDKLTQICVDNVISSIKFTQ